MKTAVPKLIALNKFGFNSIGYLTPYTSPEIPFMIKRAFWIYATPEEIIRGKHAHKKTTLVLFALAGRVTVTTETLEGKKKTFILDRPNVGLLLPPMTWHTEQSSDNAIQMALGSHPFNEKEFIRGYATFLSYRKHK